MLVLANKIKALSSLGEYIEAELKNDFIPIKEKAYSANPWFTVENVDHALQALAKNLKEDVLLSWMNEYNYTDHEATQNIGIIMAGNLPLVGAADLIAVILSGHKASIKLSSKDNILFPHLVNKLVSIEPGLKSYFHFVDKLKDFNAVIATGSNNSARYFNYYFDKYPHIIRKNRCSIGIITGNEDDDQIMALGSDIFQYFGLGCRNVSKLYVPNEYDLNYLLDKLKSFSYIKDHNRYKNNYDYNRTLLIMNNTPHYSNEFLSIEENKGIASPLSVLYFEKYADVTKLSKELSSRLEEIQCIVSDEKIPGLDVVPLGKSQSPGWLDYADGVDVMKFLLELN